ncbi:putative nucleotide pyrophosphohydrolase [Pseudomonas phage UAntarctica]|nr:putative nucleotide pyrophosphohydrolase [Pseudomonas phage UAntarctica]
MDTSKMQLRTSEEDLVARICPELTEADQQAIVRKPFHVMVDELAKPGQVMKDELNFTGFLTLLRVCTAVVNRGNELDNIKKRVVYNKDLPATPEVKLPSSQGLAEAFEGLDAEKMHLLHMAVGLAGEASEMLEAVLKHILGGELDADNVREEAGDATFYIVGLLNSIETDMNEATTANKAKLLGKRYKNGYSDEAAQARADKPAGE